jgi:hypothetical protein
MSQEEFLQLCYFSTHRFKKQMWWCTSVISALGRLRQKDHVFEASLGYTKRPCLKKEKLMYTDLAVMPALHNLRTRHTAYSTDGIVCRLWLQNRFHLP